MGLVPTTVDVHTTLAMVLQLLSRCQSDPACTLLRQIWGVIVMLHTDVASTMFVALCQATSDLYPRDRYR